MTTGKIYSQKINVIPYPKNNYNPLSKCPLRKLNGISTALKEIALLSTLTSSVPCPKMDSFFCFSA